MIDITPFLKPSDQARAGPLYVSELAGVMLTTELVNHGAENMAPLEKIGPVLATSVMDLLNSAYLTKSKWFQDQPQHTVSGFTLRSPSGEVLSLAVVHLVHRAGGGYIIKTPAESPLHETYYDERVWEEVKVETGIT